MENNNKIQRHHATYNAVGSTLRTPQPGHESVRKAYGFMADMRIKLMQKEKTFERGYFGHNPNSDTQVPKNYRTWKKCVDAFYSETREYQVTHYGTVYDFRVCSPYLVVSFAETGKIAGVMPVNAGMALTYKY